MSTKVMSFLVSLGLIAWRIVDIVRGNHSVLSWIMLVVFSLFALFELGDILFSSGNNENKDESKPENSGKTADEKKEHEDSDDNQLHAA